VKIDGQGKLFQMQKETRLLYSEGATEVVKPSSL